MQGSPNVPFIINSCVHTLFFININFHWFILPSSFSPFRFPFFILFWGVHFPYIFCMFFFRFLITDFTVTVFHLFCLFHFFFIFGAHFFSSCYHTFLCRHPRSSFLFPSLAPFSSFIFFLIFCLPFVVFLIYLFQPFISVSVPFSFLIISPFIFFLLFLPFSQLKVLSSSLPFSFSLYSYFFFFFSQLSFFLCSWILSVSFFCFVFISSFLIHSVPYLLHFIFLPHSFPYFSFLSVVHWSSESFQHSHFFSSFLFLSYASFFVPFTLIFPSFFVRITFPFSYPSFFLLPFLVLVFSVYFLVFTSWFTSLFLLIWLSSLVFISLWSYSTTLHFHSLACIYTLSLSQFQMSLPQIT